LANVILTVHVLIPAEPAVTVTLAPKPPAHSDVLAYAAEHPPAAGEPGFDGDGDVEGDFVGVGDADCDFVGDGELVLPPWPVKITSLHR
jgi:hypothetical protein